ncbi:MAG: GGDEF domain-containing protein, partial [Gammaproteobacteria bacterium]|nr:GGDEF domain-containing protein [Gammaproteobacteria bacterium]
MNGLHFGVGRRPGYLLLSALVGLGAVVALVLSYRHLAAQSTLKHATQSNVALTRIFARAVWSRYEHLVAEAPESSRERMSRRPELTQLRRDVRDHIRDTRIAKVKLYDPHGLTVFSTNGSQIGEDKSGNQGVVKARRGEVASLITRRDTMDTFEGEVTDRHIISTYVPISNRSSGRVLAVFAVYSDVTELINGIDRDTGYVLVGVLGSVLILYAVILVIAGSAHRVVREEHQQRIVAEAEIKYQAYHDPLTGLRNRRSFNEELDALLSRSGERPEKLAVMFLDVDNFKLINDGFGHSVGDEVLRTIARRLTDCLRFEDRLYHMSADEFTIVLGGQDIR